MTETTDKGHWTVETLREYLLAIIDANDGKYISIISGNDVKYLERFEASQLAMQTALVAQKLSVDIALQAADRAGTKAELAADKRFEGLNELRGMVTDQQATFIQRLEAAAHFRAIEEKLVTVQKNYEERLSELRMSVEKTTDAIEDELARMREVYSGVSGARNGAREIWAYFIAAAGVLAAIIIYFATRP